MRMVQSRTFRALAHVCVGLAAAGAFAQSAFAQSALAPSPFAAAPAAPEFELKTAFIYHFIQFTRWPAAALAGRSTLRVCVAADHPLRSALAGLNKQTAHDRTIELRTLDSDSDRDCEVMIVDNDTGAEPAAAVLTIADSATGTAMITLARDGNRIVFSINLSRARNAGLDISSKLLRLAKTVE